MQSYKTVLLVAVGTVLGVDSPRAIAQHLYWSEGGTETIRRTDMDAANQEVLVGSGLVSPRAIALDVANDRMFIIDRSTYAIHQLSLDGTNAQAVISTPNDDIFSIALDPEANRIYWVNRSALRIRRENLDGSGPEDLVYETQGLDLPPWGLALDLLDHKMYWTEGDRVKRASIDVPAEDTPQTVETLVTIESGELRSIALDLAGNKMYWIDNNAGSIQRANLDGTEMESLVTEGSQNPARIILDVPAGRMYWIDVWFNQIKRANLDGTDVQDIGVAGPGVYSWLALDTAGGKIYWTSQGGQRKVQRANLDGTNVETIVNKVGRVYSVIVDPVDGKLYWAGPETATIQRVNLDGTGVEDVLALQSKRPRLITLDPTYPRVYWNEGSSSGQLTRSFLDGSSEQTLATDSEGGIAVDSGREKLYWWTYDNRIVRANLDGTGREDILTDEPSQRSKLRTLAVDVAAGKLYWSNDNIIRRANLDGTDVEDLVTTDTYSIAAIALDFAASRIYWTGSLEIGRANLDGTGVEVILDGSVPPDGPGHPLVQPRGLAMDYQPICGDGACESGESKSTCPADCRWCDDSSLCGTGDPCTFSGCYEMLCTPPLPTSRGDVGRGEGCIPDGQVDLLDILVVLDGFQGVFATGCEVSNIDIASQTDTCVPDGVIDLSDILAVLDAFQGTDVCCSMAP